MSAVAIRWCIGLVVLAGLLASSFVAGDKYRNNAWLAKQATAERAANKKYVAEVERGNAAAGAFITEQQALQNNFQTLTEKFNGLAKRVPLVVAGGGGACAPGTRYMEPLHGQKPIGGPEALDGSQPAGRGEPYLSAGAVWMWNSALTGTDQPAGACSAANTATSACAAATTATLDHAWANHTTNAQQCAEDRLAHQRLIDFLTQRADRTPESPAP